MSAVAGPRNPSDVSLPASVIRRSPPPPLTFGVFSQDKISTNLLCALSVFCGWVPGAAWGRILPVINGDRPSVDVGWFSFDFFLINGPKKIHKTYFGFIMTISLYKN